MTVPERKLGPVRVSGHWGVSCEEIAWIEWKVEASRIFSLVENLKLWLISCSAREN